MELSFSNCNISFSVKLWVDLAFSIIFGVCDVLIGLVLSYYINSAPGGTIALTSVIFLILTLLIKNIFHREV